MEGSQSSATRFVARLLQNFKTPSAELADLAGKLNELTLAIAIRTAASAEETYTGVLTEETAKNLILYRTPSGAGGPEVSEASGSMKIWLKAGALSKYEIQLHATLKFTDNEREVTRVHTTEIKEVGTTKVIVPAEAAKKL